MGSFLLAVVVGRLPGATCRMALQAKHTRRGAEQRPRTAGAEVRQVVAAVARSDLRDRARTCAGCGAQDALRSRHAPGPRRTTRRHSP